MFTPTLSQKVYSLHSLTLEPRMNVTPARTATERTETWNVPVTSIKKPKTIGITSGPMLPSEEMRPTTPPTEGEKRSCSVPRDRTRVLSEADKHRLS